MPDSPDGQITLAVLGEKMDNMYQMLEKHIAADEKAREDHEKRLRILERNSAKMEQRLNVQTGILGTLTVVGSSIAAWLGVRF